MPAKLTSKNKRSPVTMVEEEDVDYVPPKRRRAESTSPGPVFDSNDEEVIECTEMGERLVHKRLPHDRLNSNNYDRRRNVARRDSVVSMEASRYCSSFRYVGATPLTTLRIEKPERQQKAESDIDKKASEGVPAKSDIHHRQS
jgi:hypothetical protein